MEEFFMSKKLLLDEELIAMMENGDVIASHEFYNRYYEYAKTLAAVFYSSNKRLGVSLDELVSIALETTYVVLRKYKNDTIYNFYPYWRKVAEHEIIRFLIEAKKKINDRITYVEDESDSLLLQIDNQDSYAEILKEEIERVLDPIKDTFPKETKIILFLYVEGYKIEEISKLVGLNKNQVKYRLKTIRDKIKGIYKTSI